MNVAPGSPAHCQDYQRFGWRHWISMLVFVITLINYADRTNIGIVFAQTGFPAVPNEDKGVILSSFYVGYFCTQLLGAYFTRRFGAKPTFLIAAGFWTFFDVLTPYAAKFGTNPLILVRVCMGLGEAMVYPTQHGLSSFWIPKHERGFLNGFMVAGADLGSVLANLLSPALAVQGAWCVFVAWGVLTVAWSIPWMAFAASAPEVHHSCVQSGEAQWIQQNRGASPFNQSRLAISSLCPRQFLGEPCVWAIFAGHIGMNYLQYVMISWLPSFFKGRYDLDLAASPLILTTPYIFGFLGSIAGGRFSDHLMLQFKTSHVRKGMQAMGAVISTCLMLLAAFCGSPLWATVWISAGSFAAKFQNSGFWLNMIDICPNSTAVVMGMSNMLATIPGIVGQPISQAVLDSWGGEHSPLAWSAVFGIGGAVAVFCAAIFAIWGDDVVIDARVAQEPEFVGQKADGGPAGIALT